MAVIGQIHAPAAYSLNPGKKPRETPGGGGCRSDKSLVPAGIRTSDGPNP